MEKKINPHKAKKTTNVGNGVSIKDLLSNIFKIIIYTNDIKDEKKENSPKIPKL